jgi:AcrR family transcriptional regulator
VFGRKLPYVQRAVFPPHTTNHMGIKERHERERETVRRAILDAARDLFVSEGYQNVSMRKIADLIEYSPAAIYGYFPSKDDLFFALAEEGFQLLHAMASEVPATSDPVAAIKARLWVFYKFSRRHPEHFALIFVDRSVPRIRAHYGNCRVMTDIKQEMSDLIQRSIDTGAFPPAIDARAAFRILGTAVTGVAIAALCDRLAPGEDPDALAHDVIEFMIAGMKSGVATTFASSHIACCPESDAERQDRSDVISDTPRNHA